MTDQPTLFDQAPDELVIRRDPFGTLPVWISSPTRHELQARQGVQPMPIDLPIDPTRLVRTQDPDTSRMAAESASRRGPTQRRRVWEALKKLGGATDYELSVECGILRSSAAKRRQELVDLGHVIETPFRRKTDTGTEAIVWRCSLVSEYSDS
jgi:hypothetical protein